MIGLNIFDLPTPSLLIDLDRTEKNMVTMSDYLMSRKKKNRPHVKTHKSTYLAKKQLQLGADGIAVAKVSEAEIMAKDGINNIMVANQVVGSDKLKRLAALAKNNEISLLIDSYKGLSELARAAEDNKVSFGVYIEIEVGDERCGTLPENALMLASKVKANSRLNFLGLEAYGGKANNKSADLKELRINAHEVIDILVEVKKVLENNGIEVREISIGGTPAAKVFANFDEPTEIRPGVYIFNDLASVYRESATFDDCALTVLTTIISKNNPNRFVIDAGAKALSYCRPGIVFGKDTFFGAIKGREDIKVKKLTEEHGVVQHNIELDEFKIGDKVEIIPAHTCPVVNLFDQAFCYRNNIVSKTLSIDARGKLE